MIMEDVAQGFGHKANEAVAGLKRLQDSFLHVFLVNPSSGTSIGYLDGIRSVAVLLVLIFHSWVLSGAPPLVFSVLGTAATVNITPIIGNGFIGVQLFFVLAGYLLSQRWLKADYQGESMPRVRSYFKQRIARIVPAYYAFLFLLLLFFVPTFIPVAWVYSRLGLFMLGAHLLFLQYIFPITSSSYVIAGSLWTLTMEMIFYVTLPIIIFFFLRRRWLPAFLGTAVLSVGWLYLSKHSLGPLVNIVESHTPFVTLPESSARYFLSQQFPTHLVSFAAGIGLANVHVWSSSSRVKPVLYRMLTSRYTGPIYFVVGVVVLYYDLYHILASVTLGYYFYEIASCVGFSLCIAGVLFSGQWLKAIFSIAPLRLIGIIGYSVYLWHLPLIHLFNSYPNIAALSAADRFPKVLVLTGVSVLVLASGMYLAVEKPFMLLGRRSSNRTQPTAASVSALTAQQTLPLQALQPVSVIPRAATMLPTHTSLPIDDEDQISTLRLRAAQSTHQQINQDVEDEDQIPTLRLRAVRPSHRNNPKFPD